MIATRSVGRGAAEWISWSSPSARYALCFGENEVVVLDGKSWGKRPVAENASVGSVAVMSTSS